MDPNAALTEIRRLLDNQEDDLFWGEQLAGTIQALDGWLSKGGYLPDAWRGAGHAVTVKTWVTAHVSDND